MDDLTKFIIKALVRLALVAIGTFLLQHGLVPKDFDPNRFVSDNLATVTGVAMVIVAIGWTVIRQWYLKVKIKAALKLPENSTGADLARVMARKKKRIL